MIFETKKITMKEKNTFICICVFILLSICPNANSQNCEVLNQYVDSIYTKEEIHTLEKRICKLLKKQQAVPDDNKINIYYIPDYNVPDYCIIIPPDSIPKYYLLGEPRVRVDKRDFLAGNFVRKLSRQEKDIHKIHGKSYINADVIVTNSSDSLIAYGDAHNLYITARYNKDSFSSQRLILNKMHELNMKQVFTLNSFWMSPIFGVTNKDEIIVFLYDKGDKILTIKEFVDLYSKDKSNNYFSD